MTVDLSKLKAGDTVHFRCGGEAVISTSEILKRDSTRWYIQFNGYGRDGAPYDMDGTIRGNSKDKNGPFDIIEIIPAAFDWDTIKQGDAFHFVFDDCTIWFLCEYPSGWIFTCNYDDPWKSKPLTFSCGPGNSKLIRSPEHDRGLK